MPDPVKKSKKITAQTLCEMTGTKYYKHNAEMEYQPEKELRVFDENDKLLGILPFAEALESARAAKKDLVLRNAKADPPIAKIMNYRMELLKKLFQKLGKQVGSKEGKGGKSVRLSTNISVHDLENKKKKAI